MPYIITLKNSKGETAGVIRESRDSVMTYLESLEYASPPGGRHSLENNATVEVRQSNNPRSEWIRNTAYDKTGKFCVYGTRDKHISSLPVSRNRIFKGAIYEQL